jgi:hypothetical protein
MAILSKEVRVYLHSIIEAFKNGNNLKPIEPDVLAFVRWLLPIEEEREDDYRVAFKTVLCGDPLWIPCMQCEYDGIFFDHVSEPRPKLLAPGEGHSPYILWRRLASYRTVPGERILVGKCAQCGITEHLHLLVVVHALEKRKKVTGTLYIPDHILANADL